MRLGSHFERLGLRARLTLFFAFGGLILSVTIALSTLTLTRQNLLETREQTAFRVVTANGKRVQARLTPEIDAEGLGAIIDSLSTTKGAYPLLRFGEDWTASDTQVFNSDNVPRSLLSIVGGLEAGTIRTNLDGRPAVITGIPLPNRDAAYFEAIFLDDIEATLSALGLIVTGVAAASTILAAAVGWWASRRTLTPLADVRAAAESLAAGELDTRLEPPADADLASLTASFNEMAGALEDRIQRDSRFASEVSHELRSPLMTLNASIEVLNNNRAGFNERSRTALDLLTDDVQRFTKLVEDLLEISRYDVGSASLQAEEIDISEFVRQAISHSSRPDTTVVTSLDAQSTVVVADKRRLAQVLANLIDNGAKYGGGEITVSLSRKGNEMVLTVEDNGPGVPESERFVIFDRFSRGIAGGRRGQDTGSGLGLSLVAEHIGLHGGRIWVEDRNDGRPGARFVVMLPIGELPE